MADKLLIVLVNADPSKPAHLSTPIFQATVAAAMEYDVEIVFAGQTGELAIKGTAASIVLDKDNGKTLYDTIKEAHEAGVKFKVCQMMEQWGDNLIPEIDEIVGGAYLISEAMDDDTVTFTY